MRQKWVDAEELKHIVQAAFADVAYPGDDNITISQCPCTECQDTRDFFRGKHWQEVADTQGLMQYCWGGLSIMSPQAWHFYLPAYLIIGSYKGVEDYENEEDYVQSRPAEEARETLVVSLSPLRTGHLIQWFEEQVALLSQEQLNCLAIYTVQAYASRLFDFEREDEDCKAAASFWGQLASR